MRKLFQRNRWFLKYYEDSHAWMLGLEVKAMGFALCFGYYRLIFISYESAQGNG